MLHMLKWIGVGLSLMLPSLASAQSPTRFASCSLEEAGSKERLDCYDAILPPQPRTRTAKAKVIAECRHVKEEDARLACFDSFMVARAGPAMRVAPAVAVPASRPSPTVSARVPVATPRPAMSRVTGGRCPCGSGSVCTGPRGGRFCITSGGNKRYMRR